jgi:hypothetical protein
MDAFEAWWAGYADNLVPEHRDGVKVACRLAFRAALRVARERLADDMRQAVAAERERAAKIAERIGTERDDGLAVNAGCEIAQAIREGK